MFVINIYIWLSCKKEDFWFQALWRGQRIWESADDDDDNYGDDGGDEDDNLKVLGLGEVEEGERAEGDEKGGNIHSVGIPPRHWASLQDAIRNRPVLLEF